jgi:hypothetical protein
MDYSIKIITPPAIEPVTVEEAKLAARIDYDVEDALVAMWIQSGRELAEGFQRRAYIRQTVEVSYDAFPRSPFVLPRSPMVRPVITPTGEATTTVGPDDDPAPIFTFKYYATDNTETEYDPNNLIIDYNSEPARVSLSYSLTWPIVTLRPIDAVRVRFCAGYGTSASSVPATVKDAIILYCTYRNENRAAEVESVPRQFFDLLRPDRIHLQ